MYQSYLVYFLLMQLFYYVSFFLVTFSNDLLIPVPIVNIKVKEEPAIPAGVPTTEAYEAILNVPNDADILLFISLRINLLISLGICSTPKLSK